MRKLPFFLSLLFAFSLFAGDVIKRGAAVSDAKAIPLGEVLKAPESYAEKPIVVEGVIANVCAKKGCWMELSAKAGEPGVRVTFKDYGFFVPTDSKGLEVRAEGVTSIKTLSKEHAEHLAGEGANLVRNADGTAREVSFVASGVELRK